MASATGTKLLVAGIAAATFVAGGALGPSGLSHAFNSAAEFAQFAVTGLATTLAAGVGAWGGMKLLTRKGSDGFAALVPGIVGMIFGFAVGAGGGNWARQEMASHIDHQQSAPVIRMQEAPKTPSHALSSLQPDS